MSGRSVQLVLVALSLLVLQQAVMSQLRIFGVHPELLLLGALCVAISGGPRRGAVAGFAAGLATDIYGSTTLGIGALAFTVACWLIGRIVDDRPTRFAAGVAGFTGTALGLLLIIILLRVVDGAAVGVAHAIWVFIVAGVINGALAAVVAPRLVATWRARELAW